VRVARRPIGPYIADFACIRARLVIEVDGATHWTEEEQLHDRARDRFRRKYGWRVMRIQNEDVYEDVPAPLAGPLRQRA
jgi:very-short-patch-repair endonuclease